jgi:hypothetical protein
MTRPSVSIVPQLQRLLLLRRALRLVGQASPGWTLASLVPLVLQGLLPLAPLYLLKLVVDTVTAALRSPQPDFRPTLLLILAWVRSRCWLPWSERYGGRWSPIT